MAYLQRGTEQFLNSVICTFLNHTEHFKTVNLQEIVRLLKVQIRIRDNIFFRSHLNLLAPRMKCCRLNYHWKVTSKMQHFN